MTPVETLSENLRQKDHEPYHTNLPELGPCPKLREPLKGPGMLGRVPVPDLDQMLCLAGLGEVLDYSLTCVRSTPPPVQVFAGAAISRHGWTWADWRDGRPDSQFWWLLNRVLSPPSNRRSKTVNHTLLRIFVNQFLAYPAQALHRAVTGPSILYLVQLLPELAAATLAQLNHAFDPLRQPLPVP